jgi:hypothetical protein
MRTCAVSLATRRLLPLLLFASSLACAQQPLDAEVLLDKVQRFEERGGKLADVRGIRESLFSEVVSKGTTTLFQVAELTDFERDYVEFHSVHGDGYAVRSPQGGYNFFAEKVTDFPAADLEKFFGWQHLTSLVVVPRRRSGEYSFQVLGSDVVDGTPVRLLRVSYRDLWTVWSIEANTGRILRTANSDGDVLEISDWRVVGGIAFPFRLVRTSRSGDISRLQMQEVEWNPVAADGLFQKPRTISLKNVPFHPAAVTANVLTGNGTMQVVSLPHGAQLYLDDVPKGVTSDSEGRLVLEDVAPGSHRVRLTAAGFKEWNKTVAVESGDTLAVDATLERSGPPPFSASEVEQMLRGGVSPKRAAVLVKERGVDFALDDALEHRLRAAGADGDLLLAIAKAKK